MTPQRAVSDPSVRGDVPLRDYAAIGDCHGCALVARDGGIDWCCLSRFDAEPVFVRLLDAARGGHFSIDVARLTRIARGYEPGTNVLRSEFQSEHGVLVVTDFMPVAREPDAGPNDYTHLVAPGWLVRRLDVIEGSLDVTCTFRPTRDFTLALPRLRVHGGGVDCAAMKLWLRSDLRWTLHEDCAMARARLCEGSRVWMTVGTSAHRPDPDELEAVLRATRAFWTEWTAMSRYRGPYRAMVERSALVLKLLTHSPSGASVAAATTSLPELIGGERNWDYRFCWVRDASLSSHALSALGYAGEAQELYEWLRGPLQDGMEAMQVMYGLGHERRLDERVVPECAGYRDSRPVRVGNAAWAQRQSDLYGYLLEGACIHKCLGGELTADERTDFARVVDFIGGCWREPDMGLWEMRGEPRSFVHSKAMCWLAVQRGIELLGERPSWCRVRDGIAAAIELHGRRDGHFVQAFGAPDATYVDAALLQLPLLGFPVDRATACATRRAVERELRHGDFVRRYSAAGDGLPGRDGAFLACSFWLVDSMLFEGEVAAATALFERLLAYANDLGLYAEEVDPVTGAFLGNLPQAFTHFALIDAAVNIELVRRHGPEGLAGGYSGRVQRLAWAVHGWRGFVAHLVHPGRRNLASSRASKWPAAYPIAPGDRLAP